MAYLKGRKNKIGKTYYASVVSNREEWGSKLLTISLGTSDISVARRRHQEVEDKEDGLKDGESYTWTWKSNTRRARLKNIKLIELINKWLNIKKVDTAEETYKRYAISMRAFVDAIGESISPTSIKNQTIVDFKEYWNNKHMNGGINTNLRGIKCFLRWCFEEGHIKKMPKIKMLKVEADIVKYITDAQWDDIMALDDFGGRNVETDVWKRIFQLYRDIGYRQKELVMSELEGEYLITKAKYCKALRGKRKRLNSEQIGAFKELHNLREQYKAKGRSMKSLYGRLYRTFSKALEMVGLADSGLNFHSLRHTFAGRRYLETRDMYQVCREMYHSSIKVTESSYGDFNLEDLEDDFPSLVKEPKIVKKDTPLLDTPLKISKVSRLYN